jgi:hypothetical protein
MHTEAIVMSTGKEYSDLRHLGASAYLTLLNSIGLCACDGNGTSGRTSSNRGHR